MEPNAELKVTVCDFHLPGKPDKVGIYKFSLFVGWIAIA